VELTLKLDITLASHLIQTPVHTPAVNPFHHQSRHWNFGHCPSSHI